MKISWSGVCTRRAREVRKLFESDENQLLKEERISERVFSPPKVLVLLAPKVQELEGEVFRKRRGRS